MGFVLCEGTGFLLLETQSSAMDRNQLPLLEISSISLKQEDNPISGDKSSSGVGLSQAIAAALDGVIEQPVKYFFSDLNGESYRAFE
ncbi:MAG: 3-oxoacyl-(acyl-carrier-protein) synthase [Gammaproteobacteria bacterium]|jgi:3-oxoacyl-(acyl-carrier-protein) synthase